MKPTPQIGKNMTTLLEEFLVKSTFQKFLSLAYPCLILKKEKNDSFKK